MKLLEISESGWRAFTPEQRAAAQIKAKATRAANKALKMELLAAYEATRAANRAIEDARTPKELKAALERKWAAQESGQI